MSNICKDCIFFKKDNKNLGYGSCISRKSQIKSKKIRSEFSPACKNKTTVENVEKNVEKKITKISNKKLGNKFENDFMQYLSEKGYWVSPFPGKEYSNSQPADIIACKHNIPFLFDCKTLANKSGLFPLERLEQNQRLAYKRFKMCGNKFYFLAILWNNSVFLVDVSKIDFRLKSIDIKKQKCEKENFYEN